MEKESLKKRKSRLDECFEEGLLKRIEPNKGFAEQSIKQAEHFLEESFELIENNFKDMAFVALYNASFHAARALLFRDGVKERSHYCVSKYIEEFYGEKELISLQHAVVLDALREKRNEIQYSLEPLEIREDLNEVHAEVGSFLERVKELIEDHGKESGKGEPEPAGQPPK